MKRILVILIVLLAARPAHAVETTIRVLGVFPSDAFIGPGYMQSQLSILRQAWVNTQLPGSSGVSVEVLNGDAAVPVALPGRPGTHQTLVEWANHQPTMQAIRAQWGADIIILFSELPPASGTGACGAAAFDWTNNNFVPDPTTGMDLRYRNTRYVGVVGVSCVAHAAAHEFGHLLGGGHATSPDNARLFHDSRAFMAVSCRSLPDGTQFCTEETDVLGTPAECPTTPARRCVFAIRHSRNVPLQGDGAHQNARTLNRTALSVANYHVGIEPPPTPILNPPINVHGFLISACVGVDTRHQAHWSPDPRTNVQVSTYEIWYSQPPGNPLVFGWTVSAVQTFSDVFVVGADSQIFVKACTVSRCSDFSLTSYLAQWICNF